MFSFKSTLITLIALSTSVLALPAPQSSNSAPVEITLIDAVGHEWPIRVPSDESWTPSGVAESISHVHISNTGYVPCVFYGIDDAIILTVPGEVKEMDVGPPQTITGGFCGPCKYE